MINYHVVKGSVDVTDSFEEYLTKKLEKVEYLLGDESESTAKITLERDDEDIYTLNVVLTVIHLREGLHDKVYKASAENTDAYATIDSVEEKLRRQIRKTLTEVNRDDHRLKSLRNSL